MSRKRPESREETEQSGGPVFVTPGAIAVKVYRQRHRDGFAYQTAYSLNGKRKKQTFKSLEKAKAEASAIARRLASGRVQAASNLRSEDLDTLVAARRIVEPLGISIIGALESYAAAVSKLSGVATLVEAAEDFARRRQRVGEVKTVGEVVEEMLEAKERGGRSRRHLGTLRAHCRKFADTFRMPIGDVSCNDIEAWLHRGSVSARTHCNLRNSLIALFRFAQARGYLPRDTKTEAELTERPRTVAPPVEILSPEQFSALLIGLDGEARLYAALCGLAGLRSEEALRLQWENIHATQIEVTAVASKLGQRRLVPICLSLERWLSPFRKRCGPVFSRIRAENVFLKHARKIVDPWPANGLRHSFISYRVATTSNVPETALIAGNSVVMIQRHYLQIRLSDGRLATKELGEKWFANAPVIPENVVSIVGAA